MKQYTLFKLTLLKYIITGTVFSIFLFYMNTEVCTVTPPSRNDGVNQDHVK
jgi:hypothetical protein